MHERSLMLALLKQVARIQADHPGAVVEDIAVEVGALSGVEPALLRSAFSERADSYPGATLLMHEVPVTAICQECSRKITMDRFLSCCPGCQSTRVQVIAGDTFRLLHVTLRENLQDGPLNESRSE